jgi:hypothetical protein
VVAGTIGPAAIRLLLRNHGAAVARRRRGASSALSFSHLETDEELTFRMDSIQFKSWARGNLRNGRWLLTKNKSTMANNKNTFSFFL